MKKIKKTTILFLIASLFLSVPMVFQSCSSSSDAVMIGVPKQKLKKSHKIGKYKVKSAKDKKPKTKKRK
ncbi:MAG: hypothetical protein UHM19_03400 [Bacteroidales bacterium]|jgi:hypothetical protein|nr:hypothetical protein [Bacteroidales bacterium]